MMIKNNSESKTKKHKKEKETSSSSDDNNNAQLTKRTRTVNDPTSELSRAMVDTIRNNHNNNNNAMWLSLAILGSRSSNVLMTGGTLLGLAGIAGHTFVSTAQIAGTVMTEMNALLASAIATAVITGGAGVFLQVAGRYGRLGVDVVRQASNDLIRSVVTTPPTITAGTGTTTQTTQTTQTTTPVTTTVTTTAPTTPTPATPQININVNGPSNLQEGRRTLHSIQKLNTKLSEDKKKETKPKPKKQPDPKKWVPSSSDEDEEEDTE